MYNINFILVICLKIMHMVMIFFPLVVDNLHTGIVFDPRSKALVTGNMPGILQFYMPTTDHHALSVSLLEFLQF